MHPCGSKPDRLAQLGPQPTSITYTTSLSIILRSGGSSVAMAPTYSKRKPNSFCKNMDQQLSADPGTQPQEAHTRDPHWFVHDRGQVQELGLGVHCHSVADAPTAGSAQSLQHVPRERDTWASSGPAVGLRSDNGPPGARPLQLLPYTPSPHPQPSPSSRIPLVLLCFPLRDLDGCISEFSRPPKAALLLIFLIIETLVPHRIQELKDTDIPHLVFKMRRTHISGNRAKS